ncbi:hypothetical protein ACWC5I_26270, partial [Kitasatospora sp. NPDC001574]
ELAAALDLTPQHTAVRVQRMKKQLEAGRVVVLALPPALPGDNPVPDPPTAGTLTASVPPSTLPAAPSPTPTAGRPLQPSSPTPSVTDQGPGAAATPSHTPAAALPPSAPPVTSPAATPRSTPTRTPTPTPTPAARTLRYGDVGPDVVRMQDLLIRANCVPEDVPFADGDFDDATEWFLGNFHRAAGISGRERDRAEYGPRSRQALEGAGGRAVCPSE